MNLVKIASHRSNMVLYIPAFVGYVFVSIEGFFSLEQSDQRGWVAGLLILFGLCYFAPVFIKFTTLFHNIQFIFLTALIAELLIITPISSFAILFFLMGPLVSVYLTQKASFLWIGVFTLVTGSIFIVKNGLDGFINSLPFAAGYLFFAIFGSMWRQAETNRCISEQLLAQLQQTHIQLQEYAARLEEMTITQERNRIAREMHDALGHRLTIASVQLEGAQRLIPTQPERAAHILETVRQQVREGLGELRRTVAMLRAPVDEDLPLPQVLTNLTAQVQEATGLKIHTSLDEIPIVLPHLHRQAIYRAAQEGLTNIQRHARAAEAWLQLNMQDNKITLLISDNGAGVTTTVDVASVAAMNSDGGPAHFGLSGLQERARLLGGECFIDPRPGGGTQLTFRLPIPQEDRYE